MWGYCRGYNPSVFSVTRTELAIIPTKAVNKAQAKPNHVPDTGKKVSFKKWKGEQAQRILEIMWNTTGDIDFVSTMFCENGTFDPKLKHKRNTNGTTDYSFGLNSRYHLPFIKKILADQVTETEIVNYHYKIYQERKGAFYAYYKRAKCRKLINLN